MTTPAQPGRTTTTSPPPTGAARPAGAPGSTPSGAARPETTVRPAGPRRVRLSVARLDPWSVMKLSFLLSVAVGIGLVVAVVALWTVLDGMGVFSDVDRVIADIAGEESGIRLGEVLGFGRVVSLATVIAVVDVVLLTALATLGAFLYNIGSSLVGGLHLTLSDD